MRFIFWPWSKNAGCHRAVGVLASLGCVLSAGAAKAAAMSDPAGWSAPVNAQASQSLALDLALLPVVFVTRHGILFLMVGIVLATIILTKIGFRWKLLLICGSIANFLFGSALSVMVLHRFGVAGAATVVGSHETGNEYNDHDVIAYDVVIRLPRGAAISTSFADDDFNVYPWHNATGYPGQGNIFTVRYLGHFPGYFAILSDDGSPWATAVRCAAYDEAIDEAGSRAAFSHDARDGIALDRANRSATIAGCSNGTAAGV